MNPPACTHPAHRMLHLAPVPCPECRGWLDQQGAVLNTPTMLKRYPHMRDLIASTPRQQLPDYEPTAGDRFDLLVQSVGAIARALMMVLIAGLALAFLIFLLAHG